MLFSVFTPTNKPKYIKECWASLQCQGDAPFEWVIVPNGKCTSEHIPSEIREDPRVKVVQYPEPKMPRNIGAMKRFACDQAEGDVFVELDHDDLLVPGTLPEIAKHVNKGAGFIFTDAASFQPEKGNMPYGYDPRFGWETYDFRVYGQEFMAHRSFPVTPRSLCEIFFAPDHVRCWTRTAYMRGGGHDPDIKVGDDHELILRTYLSRAQFAYTGTCGYLYRTHPGNTHRAWSKDVMKQQRENRDRYLHLLIGEWCRRHGFGFIDLKYEDIAWVDGLPVIDAADNSVGCIKAWSVNQFVPQDKVAAYMNELYRVLVPGGWACFAAPSTTGRGAFAPHYKSYWNEYVFLHFCEAEHARQVPDLNCRFQMMRTWIDYPDKSYTVWDIPYVYADLAALKGQRQPGLVDI